MPRRSDGLTYGNTDEERLEEGVITGEACQDLAIIRDIDENGQSILCYRLRRTESTSMHISLGERTHSIILDQKLQIFDGC